MDHFYFDVSDGKWTVKEKAIWRCRFGLGEIVMSTFQNVYDILWLNY